MFSPALVCLSVCMSAVTPTVRLPSHSDGGFRMATSFFLRHITYRSYLTLADFLILLHLWMFSPEGMDFLKRVWVSLYVFEARIGRQVRLQNSVKSPTSACFVWLCFRVRPCVLPCVHACAQTHPSLPPFGIQVHSGKILQEFEPRWTWPNIFRSNLGQHAELGSNNFYWIFIRFMQFGVIWGQHVFKFLLVLYLEKIGGCWNILVVAVAAR